MDEREYLELVVVRLRTQDCCLGTAVNPVDPDAFDEHHSVQTPALTGFLDWVQAPPGRVYSRTYRWFDAGERVWEFDEDRPADWPRGKIFDPKRRIEVADLVEKYLEEGHA